MAQNLVDAFFEGPRLKICSKCPIPHYENCGTCFGFGLFVSEGSGALVPLRASKAHGHEPLPSNLCPCPECGSTEKGLPVEMQKD